VAEPPKDPLEALKPYSFVSRHLEVSVDVLRRSRPSWKQPCRKASCWPLPF